MVHTCRHSLSGWHFLLPEEPQTQEQKYLESSICKRIFLWIFGTIPNWFKIWINVEIKISWTLFKIEIFTFNLYFLLKLKVQWSAGESVEHPENVVFWHVGRKLCTICTSQSIAWTVLSSLTLSITIWPPSSAARNRFSIGVVRFYIERFIVLVNLCRQEINILAWDRSGCRLSMFIPHLLRTAWWSQSTLEVDTW